MLSNIRVFIQQQEIQPILRLSIYTQEHLPATAQLEANSSQITNSGLCIQLLAFYFKR